ncbi:Restriction endonuclease [Lachnospiraceae bacterium NK3A20]|jgi:restriction system protein|nr:Restriction endonuclease [Lachnospiraceae bacterium NK3A20]
MINQAILAALAAAAILCLLIPVVIRLRRRRRERLSEDAAYAMEGHDFEYYCADILSHAGFDAEVTRGSGDFGADILAEKDGITYAIQCKCYDGPVGVAAIEEVYAGKAFYDRMVGAVMTNQYFTAPAVEMAQKLNILLWDRGYLAGMLDEEGR